MLVTGAGQGIGRAVAMAMAEQGASVFFTDNSADRVEALERALRQHPVRARGFLADITDTAASDEVARWLADEGMVIDVLVNNVGVNSGRTHPSPHDWRRVLETNLVGPAYLTTLATESMVAAGRGGAVVFLTSMHESSVCLDPSYSASKAGVVMLVKELVVRLAPAGIRVNGVAPGWVQQSRGGEPVPATGGGRSPVPLHQTSVPPAYVARTVLYLASDYFSRHTTGTILTVDGGSRCRTTA